MLSRVNGATEQYLTDLDRIQSNLDQVQRQISSGVRVGIGSDDPGAVPSILSIQSQIAANNQLQSNLNDLKSELDSGDSALQQAVTLVEQAISLGAQTQNPLTDTARNDLLQQVQGILSQLVDISGTVVDGRYIFSGDLDTKPLYTYDPTQPNGVVQLATAQSTRIVTEPGGVMIWHANTAEDIFDARNPDGTPATSNVFAAVGALATALQNNDTSTIQAIRDQLTAADDHLNQQLGLYGIAENRVSGAQDVSSSALINEKQRLSTLRDTDVAGAALELNQLQLQQEAALSARAKMQPQSLFDYLA